MALRVVELPDGRRVAAGAVRDLPVDGIDFAVVLLGRRPARSDPRLRPVVWPDLRLPRVQQDAEAAICDAHQRAEHERIAIVCGHGTGRTGAALAVLAAMSGVPADDAVEWVRRAYRARAVETPWQRRWVRTTARRLAP